MITWPWEQRGHLEIEIAHMAATLTVWKFGTPDGAHQSAAVLRRLSEHDAVDIQDAALVSWPPGRNAPTTCEVDTLVPAGTLVGAFWGLLFGFIFFVPLLGVAVGTSPGAVTGTLADIGIDDDFLTMASKQIRPGSSALFVISADAVFDKLHEAFKGTRAELIHTSLSTEQERRLHDAFEDS
jgi:uncharacterized membrane protein